MHTQRNNGRLVVVCGPMFAGKTEELIRRVRRRLYAGRKVVAFKHSADQRYHDLHICSHGGGTLDAIPIKTAAEVDTHLSADTEVVCLDEVQFFDEAVVDLCEVLAGRGILVIVAGLDLDSKGVPFEVTMRLSALAEEVVKLSAVCVQCGADAARSQRLASGQDRIAVGADDEYEARCRACWTPVA